MVHAGVFYWGDVMPYADQKKKTAWRLTYREKQRAMTNDWHRRKSLQDAPIKAAAKAKKVIERNEKVQAKQLEKQKRIDNWNAIKNTCRKCGANKPEEFKVEKKGSIVRLCRKCRNAEAKASRERNPETAKATRKRSYETIRKNPTKLIKTRIRQRIQQAIRNIGVGVAVRSGKFRYLGCTGEEAACYLQQQFKGCMSWDNYGTAWHIDHVFPLASYDLSQEEERAKAFHYTNLQPLWARSNMKKSDHMPNKPHQPRLLLA